LTCPPEKYRTLAAFWMIWSAARKEKFQVITSTTGRRPVIAIPMAAPTNPPSLIGVSITRCGP
jgi:hypothetical protein